MIFGEDAPYLSLDVARRVAGLFPDTSLNFIKARHWLQWDEPEALAKVVTQPR
ncbi:alpha/beta fold hydrolase [Streptomyces adustus]|uniref:alpha/beta fold hydrolase n=1 Tax=Streptomyces adustus TaxID=1609272 RepID=UPI0012E0A6A8|nr:hypothetical protein [Streptomyces adustus]